MNHSNRFYSDSFLGKAAAAKLRDAALLALMDNTSDIVFIKDTRGAIAAASMSYVELTGHQQLNEVIGRTDLQLYDDHTLARQYMEEDRQVLTSGQNLIGRVEQLPSLDGKTRYGSTSKYILRDEDGRTMGLLCVIRDITSEYLTYQFCQNELSVLFELTEGVYAASFIDIDDWRMIGSRRQYVDGILLPTNSNVAELVDHLQFSVMEKDSEIAAFYRSFTPASLRQLYQSGTTQTYFESLRYMPDKSIRWVREDVRFLIDPETGHLCLMLVMRDIDAEKQEEADLVASARLDKMTMLLNRETTIKEIDRALQESPHSGHTLLMLDVDNFKRLNDTLGHQAGDAFLIALTRELKHYFREHDIIGRLGGDEFLVLMKNISAPSLIGCKIQGLLARTEAVCSTYPGIGLSISIGVSHYPENGHSLAELYAAADKALYIAKRNGKGQFVLF